MEINDNRTPDAFRITTFSNYQRSAVKKELLQNLINSKLEASLHWMIELLCSGHVSDIWEIILYFYAKHIHVGNPKLPIYIEARFDVFKQCMTTMDEMSIRNNEVIRKLFSEMITILCLSTKHHSYEIIKVNKEDFNLLNMDRLRAPSVTFIESIFKPGDPKTLFIPLNEFSYMVHVKNTMEACYWIEWIFEYTSKKKCTVVPRDYSSKHTTDCIWIIWEILIHYASTLSEIIQKIMKSTLNLFCIRYTPACNERRRFLLYYAISLCCEPIKLDIVMIDAKQKKLIDPIYEKFKFLYTDIKKHEVI